MDLSTQKELFTMIKNELDATGMDTVYVQSTGGVQVGDSLRVLLPMDDNGSPALMDFTAAVLGNDADILQYYTTLTLELGAGKAELEQAMSSLNFYCPIGSF
ncbi:MAG: hypothetical protein IKL99_04345, partial [Oscillospiraceae bacterium]|nr:hypothetical protein [Oscillospiraceae bacterium]